MGSENCRRQLWQERERKEYSGELPQTLEACCLCQLKADAANWRLFWAATKEYQSAFQGVSRQFAQGGWEVTERERGEQGTYQQFAQPKMYRARNRLRGADRDRITGIT